MKRSKSSSPRNSCKMRGANSTWSLMSWSTPNSKRKRKGSPDLTKPLPRSVSVSEKLSDINKLDSKGRSLLFYAARCDQPEVAVQLLAAGCDANLADYCGNTPLHEAAECGHIDVVRVLLQNENCVVDAMNCLGQTPLMRAVYNDHLNIIKLLQKAGSNINAVDHLGKSPLLIGLQEGSEKSCMHLIKSGSDVNVVDQEGHSVLFFAVHSSYLSSVEVAKKVVKAGCDISKNAKWLIDTKTDENCLLLTDPKFHASLLSKVGIKEKHVKSDLITTLKVTFRSLKKEHNDAINAPET